jgi:hypothetical protein
VPGNHPFEVFDWDLLDFWLKRVPSYDCTQYHRAVHEQLIKPRYNEDGPLPTMVVLAGGEQAGKSTVGGAHIFAATQLQMGGIFWIVGERYDDCRLEFQYMMSAAINAGALDPDDCSFPNEGVCRAKFKNGSRVRTLSSSDTTTLASESPDGVLMVEAGRQSFQAFKTLYTRTIHHTGWFLVSGTFEQLQGRWFADLFKECQGDNIYGGVSLSLPSWANPKNFPLGENDPKILAARKTLSEEDFAERFLGIPRSTIGAVFHEFRRHLHVSNKAEFDSRFPVTLWVDPGYDHPYAVLFAQFVNEQVHIVDELHVQHLVNEDVISLVVNHRLFRHVELVVIDIASKQHAGAQEPSVDVWRKALYKRGIPIRARYVRIEDGILRTHDKLRVNPLNNEPYLLVHPRCKKTIWEFEEGYRFPVRQTGEIGIAKPIDKGNDAMKAIAYGLVDHFGVTDRSKTPIRDRVRRRMSYDRMVS